MTRARQVFDLAKPAHLLFSNDPIDLHRFHDVVSVLRSWSSASSFFISPDQTLSIIAKMRFTDPHEDLEAATTDAKGSLAYALFQACASRRLDEALQNIVEFLEQECDEDWAF